MFISQVPKSTNIYFPMPPSGSFAWISAYVAQSTGKGGVYLSFSKSFDKTSEFYERLYSEKDELERALGSQLSWYRDDNNKIYIGVPNIQFRDLHSNEDRQKVIEHLAKYSNKMVNVFRPRLGTLSKELL